MTTYNRVVWRLATSTRPARQVCDEAATRPGRWHDVGDQILYAYESRDLAAASLSRMTLGVAPAQLVLERIQLPEDITIHGEYRAEADNAARRARFAPGLARLPVVNLCDVMRRDNLLTMWIASPYAGRERTVLINVTHPAFAKVKIHTQVLEGGNVFSNGPCGAVVQAHKPAVRKFRKQAAARVAFGSLACI